MCILCDYKGVSSAAWTCLLETWIGQLADHLCLSVPIGFKEIRLRFFMNAQWIDLIVYVFKPTVNFLLHLLSKWECEQPYGFLLNYLHGHVLINVTKYFLILNLKISSGKMRWRKCIFFFHLTSEYFFCLFLHLDETEKSRLYANETVSSSCIITKKLFLL